MTSFWSWYITLLTSGTLLALTWLIFATRKGQRPDTTDQTMGGHSFDGIQEYDNRYHTGGSCCLLAPYCLL